MATRIEAMQKIITTVEAKGETATPEELVFLAKALEAIAAPATVAEIETLAEVKKTEVEAVGDTQKAEISTMGGLPSVTGAEGKKLKVTSGTATWEEDVVVLSGDVTGDMDANSISANVVGITELNVTDGTDGQVLKTDGAGTLSFQDDGGGGGTGAIVVNQDAIDENYVGTYQNQYWDEHTSYSRVHQFDKGQFAVLSGTFDNQSSMQTGLRIAPFTVNQTTGMMSWGTPGWGFHNTSGYVHSTQSFGFSGPYVVNWGHSAWGSNTSHYYGGCYAKVQNNTVTQGSHTGNSAYASENTSNGMLAVYHDSAGAYFNIPNSAYTSYGAMNTSANAQDWPDANETNHSGSTCYIWRCIGKTVGEGHAGVLSNNTGCKAMTATGSGGTVGSYITGGQTASGLGFELENGKQLYFSRYGSFVRASKTGDLSAATVTEAGVVAGGIQAKMPGSNNFGDLAALGVKLESGFSYYTGGYPAKEDDTFYMLQKGTGSDGTVLMKFKIVNTSASNFTIESIALADLNAITQGKAMSTYSQLVDVTGTNDDFIVMSARSNSYQPSHTFVINNPLKDL